MADPKQEGASVAGRGAVISVAGRRAVATSLRAAAVDLDEAGLLYLGSRTAWLLLARAARRLLEAVVVSERGLSALAPGPPPMDAVDDANPLKPRLAPFAELAARTLRYDLPDRDGRLPDPGERPPAALVQALRALLDDALRAFEVDPARADEPAGRTRPLRPPPPEAPPRPPALSAAPRGPHGTAPAGAAAPGRADAAPGVAAVPRAEPVTSPPKAVAPVTSAAFWALMDRWQVADLTALALVGHPGTLTRTGGRPRFRLVGPEAAAFAVLREIDTTLTLAALDPAGWLRASQASLGSHAPLAHMAAHGPPGAQAVHRLAVQEGLARSVG